MMITEIGIQQSSGNIFADLDFDDPEEMLAKAEIVRNISNSITQLQIDYNKVAELIGIKQSEVYDLTMGKFLHLPKDQLSQFLHKLTHMQNSRHPKEEVLKLQKIVENGLK
jgi:predicted XRE-type DNA-binding protein